MSASPVPLRALALLVLTSGCESRPPGALPPSVVLSPPVSASASTPSLSRALMGCPLDPGPPPAPPRSARAPSGPWEAVLQALPDANAAPVVLGPGDARMAWVAHDGAVVNVSETGTGVTRLRILLDGLSWPDVIRGSRDGRYLLVGDGHETSVFDMERGGARIAALHDPIADAAWIGEGRLATITADGILEQRDARGASLARASPEHPPWQNVTLHPEGRHVAAVRRPGPGERRAALAIWDAETGALCGDLGAVETDHLDAVAWSPDGGHLVVMGNDRSVTVYDARTGERWEQGKAHSFRHHRAWALAWSEDGAELDVSAGGHLARFSASRGALPLVRIASGQMNVPYALASRHVGGMLLAFGAGEALSVDPQSGTKVATLRAPLPLELPEQEVLLAPRPRLAVAHFEGLGLWDLGAGKLVSVLAKGDMSGHEGFVLFASPDTATVGYLESLHGISVGPDPGTMVMWDADSGALRARMYAPAFSDAPLWITGGTRFVWRPDGGGDPSIFDTRTARKLRAAPSTSPRGPCDHHSSRAGARAPVAAMVCGETVVLWSTSTGQVLRQIDVPVGGGAVGPVFPSPDGRWIVVTVSRSGTGGGEELVMYGASAPAPVFRLGYGGKVVFHPDGARMVVAGDTSRPADTVDLVEVRTGKTLRALSVPPGASAPDLAFSPDGASLAGVVGAPGGEAALVVWDVATGVPRGRLRLRSWAFRAFGVQWLGGGVIAVNGARESGLVLFRVADGAVVRVHALALGARMGYLATTPEGVFDLQGLPPEAVRFRHGDDVAHAELVGPEQVAAHLRRPGLVGDLVAGKSMAPAP